MAYSFTYKLKFPLDKYRIDRAFLKDCKYRDDGKWIHWGLHLGEDYKAKQETPVYAIGKGKVVYSKLHPGKGPSERNWGNIVIIAHKNPKTKEPFFSLYGHLKTRFVERDDKVQLGQKIGTIAPANTPENGWWAETHLHFAIYLGQWKGRVLPGYYKSESKRTSPKLWAKPNRFIREYNKQ